jgi:hypothetical protein
MALTAVQEINVYAFGVYVTTLSVSYYRTSSGWVAVNSDLEGMCKEAAVASFKDISKNCLGDYKTQKKRHSV